MAGLTSEEARILQGQADVAYRLPPHVRVSAHGGIGDAQHAGIGAEKRLFDKTASRPR